MKKRETTKNFSIRTEIAVLDNFEQLLSKKGTNKNKVLNDFMSSYVMENLKHYNSVNTNIQDNIENLGYERSFFSKEDVVFYVKAQNLLSDGFLMESEDEYMNCFIHTGVKYSFSKIGIVIYSTWGFCQTKELETNRLSLTLDRTSIIHNTKNDTVDFMDDWDYTDFDFI